jgi:hemerythrin-like domain-containing protein
MNRHLRRVRARDEIGGSQQIEKLLARERSQSPHDFALHHRDVRGRTSEGDRAERLFKPVRHMNERTRRSFLRAGVILGASTFAGATLLGATNEKKKDEEEVSPAEDLMREHGVLKRVLLIYGEAIRRIDANQDLQPETVADSAKIIRSFIEDYHEKLEDDFLFSRFEKANQLVDLVKVLRDQHAAGRRVTDITMRFATNQALKNANDRRKLADSMRQFIRMYNPHEAREDTVLFPAFRKIVSENEYDSLGEDFEKKEHELFGEEGFHGMVDKVAGIEKKLGIYDLAQFTPKPETRAEYRAQSTLPGATAIQ